MQRSKEALVRQFGECLSPIMPNGGSQRACIADQRWQVGSQIIPASCAKLLHQIITPIGSVILQAIAEDCVWGLVAKCFHYPVPHCVEMSQYRSSIIVVE